MKIIGKNGSALAAVVTLYTFAVPYQVIGEIDAVVGRTSKTQEDGKKVVTQSQRLVLSSKGISSRVEMQNHLIHGQFWHNMANHIQSFENFL